MSSFISLIILIGYFGANNLFVITEQRKVGPFNSVHSSGLMNVYIQKGDSQSVVIRADNNIVSKIKTTVTDGVLLITNESGIRGERVTSAYVTYTNLESLYADGASTLTTRGPVQSSNLKVVGSGAAELKLQIEGDSLRLDMDGSANVQLAGSTQYFKFDIHRVGDLMAYNLKTNHTVARIITGDQSPGIARIHADELLDVTIKGPRHLYYLGNPKIVNQSIQGGGKLKQK